MGAFLVVEPNPVRYHPTGMLQRFKALPVHTLLLDRANDPLHQSVFLRAMRRDEFLLQAVALARESWWSVTSDSIPPRLALGVRTFGIKHP